MIFFLNDFIHLFYIALLFIGDVDRRDSRILLYFIDFGVLRAEHVTCYTVSYK
jgi:hypothetical protein